MRFAIYTNSHVRFARNFEWNLRIEICAKIRMRFAQNFERDVRNAKFGMGFGKCDLLKTSNVIWREKRIARCPSRPPYYIDRLVGKALRTCHWSVHP